MFVLKGKRLVIYISNLPGIRVVKYWKRNAYHRTLVSQVYNSNHFRDKDLWDVFINETLPSQSLCSRTEILRFVLSACPTVVLVHALPKACGSGRFSWMEFLTDGATDEYASGCSDCGILLQLIASVKMIPRDGLTLADWARHSIHVNLKASNMFHGTSKLPLPNQIKRYLLYGYHLPLIGKMEISCLPGSLGETPLEPVDLPDENIISFLSSVDMTLKRRFNELNDPNTLTIDID